MELKKQQVNFIGIGFPRCGTTWLSRCLSEHPEICFSNEKEVHYFDLDYSYEQGDSFYAKHFTCAPNTKVVGEFTPEYIREAEKCAKRIKNDYPDVKLIVVMRDPVQRSFSHYRYRKYKAGLYKSFTELIENADTDPVVQESVYIESLKPFLDLFDKKNILFLIHEESLVNPQKYIAKTFEFLSVDVNFIPPSLEKAINTTNSFGTRFLFLEHFLNNLRWKLRGSANGRALIKFSRLFGGTRLVTWIRAINRKPVEDPEQLTERNYQQLWKYFEPSVKKLESTLNMDTSLYWGELNK